MPKLYEESTDTVDESATEGTDEGFDREALENTVADKLAALGKDPEPPSLEDDGEADDAEETPDEGEDADAEEVDVTDDDEDEGVEDDSDDDGEEAAASQDHVDTDAPTLPDAHRRSLRASGWEDDEIDQNLSLLGDKFLRIAEQTHHHRNAQTAAWAEAGRRAQQESQDPAQPQQQQSQSNAIDLLDVAALKEEFGDDALIDQLAARINPLIQQVQDILPKVQDAHQTAAEQEMATLRKQVEDFFSDEKLTRSYKSFYGDGENSLTAEQIQNRQRVLEEADAISTGAKLQGRRLSVEEALSYAHDIVSADFRETAVRSGIRKEAKKRSQGKTQKPGKRKTSRSADRKGPPSSRSELESRVAQRLAKVWNSR